MSQLQALAGSLGALGAASPALGGGGFTSPDDYDSDALGYWKRGAANWLKAGDVPVTTLDDQVEKWLDSSTANNDLVRQTGTTLYKPAIHSGCIRLDGTGYFLADLTAAYTGTNLFYAAKVAVRAQTVNFCRLACVYQDATADTAATGGVFCIHQNPDQISAYRKAGGPEFSPTTTWTADALIVVSCHFDGTNMKFYVGGVQVGADEAISDAFNAQNFNLGRGTGATELFAADIVEHGLWKDFDATKRTNVTDWLIAN